MSVITGEVIPDPHGSRAWVVVIKHDDNLIAQVPFPTEEKGEKFLLETLEYIKEKAESEGYL